MVQDARAMDLSGNAPGYRAPSARCPQCAAMLRAEVVPSAKVEACDTCGGVWVDWFDGDVRTLAVEAEAARLARGDRPSLVPAGTEGSGDCPRCQARLGNEVVRFADALEAELVGGVEILRCAECAGCFVPRSSAHLLLERVREPRTATFWEVLVTVLKRLFTLRR